VRDFHAVIFAANGGMFKGVKNIMKKTGVLLLCLFMLFAELSWCIDTAGTFGGKPAAAEAAETKDEFYSAVVKEGVFYHDGRNEWFIYYFADVGRTQFEKLKNETEDYEYLDQEVETEIHLSIKNNDINLKNYVGKKITFKGDFFASHTIYHQRSIVFMIEEITDAVDVSPTTSNVYAPLKPGFKTLTTAEKPLPPDFIKYGTNFWFNGLNSATAGNSFAWAKYEDGSNAHCLMILVDALNKGGANRSLHIPKFGLPTISKPSADLLYITWRNPEDPLDIAVTNDVIMLLFPEKNSNMMAISANVLKGIEHGPDSDVVNMPVSVYKDKTGQDRYYVPLYAILNEVGGGVMYDPFGDGVAFIYTGEALQGYSGVWEVADNTEYRLDVDIGGKPVSVGNYWWSLELRPDGTFTEIDRHYKDEGDWFRTEFKGQYAFFGRILAMKYTSDSLYRGGDFNNLTPEKVDGPFAGKWGEDGVDVYAEYVDDWSRPDFLNIRGSRALFSKELSGRKW